MPKARPAVAPAEAATGAAPAADAEELFSRFDEAWKTLGPGVAGLLASAKRANGAQDLGCSCAKCLRKAGPVREDSEERILHITHVLADVYEETPNPEERIKPHHRQRARQFMAAVEANDVERLEAYFQECPEEHRGEIVGELVISASQAGHTDILRCLAKHATDDDYLDMSDSAKGARPLMFAAHNGHVAAVRLLLELGADPNATDDHGYNALTISTFCDRAGVAEVLCQYKDTIIDQLDERDRTAMCYAALYGSDNCVHVLAAHGADMFHRDDEQADPLELAEQSGRSSTAEAIRKLQLKAKLAMRRAERKADAAGRAAACALDDKEKARREAEAEARAAELLAECQREEKAKAQESERRKKLKKQQQAEAAARRNARKLAVKASSSSAGSDQDSLTDHRRGVYCNGDHLNTEEDDLSRAILSVTDIGMEENGVIKQGAGSEVQGNGVHGANGHAVNGECEGLRLPPENATEPVLRDAFNALLEEAKECKDTCKQALFIDAIKTLLPRAAALGISVKYGKKVLQRLETVEPAKAALLAALTAVPMRSADLEAALKLARPAACVLDPELMSDAESALVACKAAEQQKEAERQMQQQQQQAHLSPCMSPRSPRSPRKHAYHHAAANLHGHPAHVQLHHHNEHVHQHHTQHQPGHHPKSPRHVQQQQQHKPVQPPPPPPYPAGDVSIAPTISAAQPHSPNNRRLRHEPRSPRADHIFDGHAKAQTRTNAWHIPQPSPPAAKPPPPPPPPPPAEAIRTPVPISSHQNGHDNNDHEQHTTPPGMKAMTPHHDAPKQQAEALHTSQQDACNGSPLLQADAHPTQPQDAEHAAVEAATTQDKAPPVSVHMNHVAEKGFVMDAAYPEVAVMGHALQPAHAPVPNDNGFACHAPALMSHHIQSNAGQFTAALHKQPVDSHPTNTGCFQPVLDAQPLSTTPTSEYKFTSYMATHLANTNTSIPSPTAPLSVAAAALDLGGLSLNSLNTWHTGLNGLAADNMQYGDQNLLVALHNNQSNPNSAANSSLPSSIPSAAAGFNTPGCLAVPPALTALWSKPVSQVSNGVTATYSSTGTSSSYTGLPGSPLKSVVSVPTPPAGQSAVIQTQQSLTPTEGTVKAQTPLATTPQPPQPTVQQPVPPPQPPPQPPLQKRLSQPNHINQHQHHQAVHHNVHMMGGHGHGYQNGMRPMQGGHMHMHAGHNQYHMRPHVPPNMNMHSPMHVQQPQQHMHGMHAHNMYGHGHGHVPNVMMDGRHGHPYGPMHMHAGHVNLPHHQPHGHPHMAAKGHHIPNMGHRTPFAEVACTVCGTNEKNAVCWPCRHTCMCLRCATVRLANRGSCPVCRVGLENVYEVGAS